MPNSINITINANGEVTETSQPETATKGGARHSRSDMELGRKVKGMAREIEGHMDALGFADEPPATEWQAPEMDAEKSVIAFGHEVKALGDGKVGGYLVRFSTKQDPDLTGDFFTPDTDFGEHAETPVLYQHGLDPELKARVLGKGKVKKDGVGVWVEAQLQLRDEYEKAIYQMAEAGKLGWSSGTASHLVERSPEGKAARITRWPLGLDASLTPTPAEPRNAAITLKAYITELELDKAGRPAALDDAQVTAEVVTTETKSITQPVAPVGAETNTETLTMTDQPTPAADNSAELATKLDTLIAGMSRFDKLAADVEAMKTAPVQKTGGLAEQLEANHAAAYNRIPKEDLATEQLTALKAYLNREMPRDEWRKHSASVAKQEAEAMQAFKAITRAMPHQIPYAVGRYMEAAAKATLVEGTASLGGNLVPTGYSNQLVGTLMEDSILRKAGAYQIPVSGTNAFKVPSITRSGSAPLTSELAAATQSEPTFGEVQFDAYAYRAQYIASREQIADSRIPLDTLLIENASWQIVQSENNHFGAGTGSSQPQGVNQATTSVSAGSILSLLDTDDVIDLYHAIPYQYRANAVWFANDQVIKQVRKLRDMSGGAASTGNYIWQPGLQAGQPDRLLGRPIYTLNSMASSGSASNVMVFGDPRFFWIADFNTGGTEFQVLNELYAASAAVGWTFWRRFDSNIMVSEAFRGMRLS